MDFLLLITLLAAACITGYAASGGSKLFSLGTCILLFIAGLGLWGTGVAVPGSAITNSTYANVTTSSVSYSCPSINGSWGAVGAECTGNVSETRTVTTTPMLLAESTTPSVWSGYETQAMGLFLLILALVYGVQPAISRKIA
jgi:hypothetical protein